MPDFLDLLTIAIILIVVALNVYFLIFLARLPGSIAQERGHPQADAISVCGWLSLLTLFATWAVAMIWAYAHPARVALTEPQPTKEQNMGGAKS
jgi:hypothetical protein